jgi:hypothetical protein
VVVEQVQDLDRAAIGQVPGGGVCLPELVGQLSLEADEGGARPLMGLRDDQTLAFENAPDGGDRRRVVELGLEPLADALRTVVVACLTQLSAESDDLGDYLG